LHCFWDFDCWVTPCVVSAPEDGRDVYRGTDAPKQDGVNTLGVAEQKDAKMSRHPIKLHEFYNNPNTTRQSFDAFSDHLPTCIDAASDGIGTEPEKSTVASGRWVKLQPTGDMAAHWDRWMALLSQGIRDSISGFPKDLPTMRQELMEAKNLGQTKLNVSPPQVAYIKKSKVTMDNIDKELIPHLKEKPSTRFIPHSAIPTPDLRHLPHTKTQITLPSLSKLPKGYSLWMRKAEKKGQKSDQKESEASEHETEEPTSSAKKQRERFEISLLGHPAKVQLKSNVEVAPHLLWLYLAEDAWLNGTPRPSNVSDAEWQKDPRSKPGKDQKDWQFDRSLCPCPGCTSMTKKADKASTKKEFRKTTQAVKTSEAVLKKRVRVAGLVPRKSTQIPGKIANVHVGEGLIEGEELWWDSEHEWENQPATVCTVNNVWLTSLQKRRKLRHFVLREIGLMPPEDAA